MSITVELVPFSCDRCASKGPEYRRTPDGTFRIFPEWANWTGFPTELDPELVTVLLAEFKRRTESFCSVRRDGFVYNLSSICITMGKDLYEKHKAFHEKMQAVVMERFSCTVGPLDMVHFLEEYKQGEDGYGVFLDRDTLYAQVTLGYRNVLLPFIICKFTSV